MGTNVKLSDAFVEEARALAKRDHRSLPKQIEFYFRVAKAAEENPDLPFKMVLGIMNSLEESTSHPFTDYEKYRSQQNQWVEVHSTHDFDRDFKKLFPNQLTPLADAIEAVKVNPLAGVTKKGTLKEIRIYKYRSLDQVWLLAYSFDGERVITLHAVGPHENFYKQLKRRSQ